MTTSKSRSGTSRRTFLAGAALSSVAASALAQGSRAQTAAPKTQGAAGAKGIEPTVQEFTVGTTNVFCRQCAATEHCDH